MVSLVRNAHCVPKKLYALQIAYQSVKIWYALYIAYQMVSLVRNAHCVPKIFFDALHIDLFDKNWQKQILVRIVHCVPKLHFRAQYAMRIIFWYAVRIAYQMHFLVRFMICWFLPRTNLRLVRHANCVPIKFWYALHIAYQSVSLVRNVQCVPFFGTQCAFGSKKKISWKKAMRISYQTHLLLRIAYCVSNLNFLRNMQCVNKN